MKRKPLDLTTAELADGAQPTFTSVRQVVGKKCATEPAPRAMIAYGRSVTDAQPPTPTQKRRAKKQKKPADTPAPVTEAPRHPIRSIYELVGISEIAYKYAERSFVEYADNIALLGMDALHEHAYDVGVHPSESRSHLLDELEAQYLKQNPDQKGEAAKAKQADLERLSPGERVLNSDHRAANARARKLARERGDGLSLRERAIEIMKRGR